MTAYSGDLGEELDQQRVVIGGVVAGVRRVITKAKATMGVATVEDLQGTIEVIVFPRTFETTASTWQEDSILLVAGRVDHKGDGSVILADSVWTWEEATALGAEGFASQVQAAERGRRGGREGSRWGGSNVGAERGSRSGSRSRSRSWSRRLGDGRPRWQPGVPGPGVGLVPAGARERGNGTGEHGSNGLTPNRHVSLNHSATGNGPNGLAPNAHAPNGAASTVGRVVPHVSPLRGGGVLGELVVQVAASAGSGAAARAAGPTPATAHESDPGASWSEDESALPPEAAQAEARQAAAPTRPIEAAGATLHLRFGALSGDELADAFAGVREILGGRPGQTSVMLQVPLGDGRTQPMELRTRVAYDAELLAELERRFGGSVVAELSPG